MWEPYYFQFYKIKTYNLSILEYGCELWDDCCIRDTQKLECLQLEAARIVTGLPILF
jgi:hypothetical protein